MKATLRKLLLKDNYYNAEVASMKYKKLIALKVDDFSSSIFFENNYGMNDDEIIIMSLRAHFL